MECVVVSRQISKSQGQGKRRQGRHLPTLKVQTKEPNSPERIQHDRADPGISSYYKQQLSDTRLSVSQRRMAATKIARLHGNQYLQRTIRQARRDRTDRNKLKRASRTGLLKELNTPAAIQRRRAKGELEGYSHFQRLAIAMRAGMGDLFDAMVQMVIVLILMIIVIAVIVAVLSYIAPYFVAAVKAALATVSGTIMLAAIASYGLAGALTKIIVATSAMDGEVRKAKTRAQLIRSGKKWGRKSGGPATELLAAFLAIPKVRGLLRGAKSPIKGTGKASAPKAGRTREPAGKGAIPPTTAKSPAEVTSGIVARLKSLKQKIVVNIGGTGAGHEPANAINLNPNIVAPRKGIPNHVAAKAEEIGSLFESGSVNELVGFRLPHAVIDWKQVATGAHRAMAPGAEVSISLRWSHAEEAARMLRAFKDAGFKGVKIIGDALVMAVR